MASSKLIYVNGDLFTAPKGSILVHACNTVGSWGAGIALEFKARFPNYYQRYRAYCKEHGKDLVGSCLLLKGEDRSVACLFTSRAYGKAKDSPDDILAATEAALIDLMKQNVDGEELHAWWALKRRPGTPLTKVSSRFNAGKFGVPWEKTAGIVDGLGMGMAVYTPDE